MASNTSVAYDPNQTFEVQTQELVYRQDGDQSWMATIYQPQGAGPFPALLDVHGGAWNRGERSNDHVMNQALAASGIVVMAIDFRLAPDHPYPAQIVDVNYATRWLKAHSAEFNADPQSVGGMGSSSGGHTLMMSAMRPQDHRYAALPLAEGADLTASGTSPFSPSRRRRAPSSGWCAPAAFAASSAIVSWRQPSRRVCR